MLVGNKVLTPDKEQGFISAVYADGEIDVDILAEDAKHAEDTTTISYNGDEVVICVDQMPVIGDITPYGKVWSLELLTDGIIEVGFECEYQETRTLWLCDVRLDNYPDDCGLVYAHWSDPKDYEKVLEHYDLEIVSDGKVLPKALAQDNIPFACELEVVLPDKSVQRWDACVSASGFVEWVATCKGKKLTTLEELRATGILEAEFVLRHFVTDF